MRGTSNEHEAWAPNPGYKAARPTHGFPFNHNHLLRMSISSLDTDLDLCDLGVASVMSSPDIQRTQLPLIEDQEFHPVIIDQLDPQGRIPLPLASTNI